MPPGPRPGLPSRHAVRRLEQCAGQPRPRCPHVSAPQPSPAHCQARHLWTHHLTRGRAQIRVICAQPSKRSPQLTTAHSRQGADSGPPGRPGKSRSVRAVRNGHPRQCTSGALPPWAADGTVCRTARPSAAAAPAPPRRCRPPGGASRQSRTLGQDTALRRPVRGRPWKADGYADRATGSDVVRYASVDTATYRLTVTHHDTRRDKKETAPRAALTQPGGRLRW